MKRLLKLVVLLVAVLVIGAIVTFILIDRVARSGVERGATYALGVETSLRSADVRVFRGEFDMGGLRVANPGGFKTPHFLTLEDGGVAVSLGSLRQDVVTLPSLTLTGVDINLEKQAGRSNYNVILENLQRLGTSEKPPEDAPGKKRYIVNEIVIRDVLVHADVLPIGGELTRLHLPIPEIRLSNVGSDTDRGILMSELTGVIIRALFTAIVQRGGDLLPKDLIGDLGNALAGLGNLPGFGLEIAGAAFEQIGGVLEDVGRLGEGAAKSLGSKLDDVGRGLGGLFGGDRKKDEE